MRHKETIYADYQATTPVDERVVAKMAPYWTHAFGNPHANDHIVGWRAQQSLEDAAASVGALVGADADEVIFTSGATEANNLALFGLFHHEKDLPRGRRRLLVSAIEHKCVLEAAKALARRGVLVEEVPVDGEGFILLEALADKLKEDVLAVSVMAVNNEIGTVQDISRIAQMLEPYGILLHCDAAQAPSAIDISTLAQAADLISLSAHKMYGPPGVGALVIRKGVEQSMAPLFYGGGQQGGVRSGTVPLPLCVGMAQAAELLMTDEATAERERVACLRNTFVARLQKSLDDCALVGPPSTHRHPGNASVSLGALDGRSVLSALQPRLAASSAAACTTGMPEPSHVLQALGLDDKQAEAVVRFSFGRFTTDDDIATAAELVVATVRAVREAA